MLGKAQVIGLLLVIGLHTAAAQTPLGTAFTYQGQLKENGVPVNSTSASFRCALYDAETAGNQIGSSVDVGHVTVSNGLFTIPLDFGSSAFNGNARWLNISVYKNGIGWVALAPRQKLTAAPYALHALNAGGLTLPYQGSYVGDEGDLVFHVTYAGAVGYAVVGEATGGESTGVYGKASGLDGIAVLGYASGSSQFAVMGNNATNSAYPSYGGRFSAAAANGYGVYGLATSATGTTYGIYGQTNSAAGYGGYFVGRGYFSGNLGLGMTNPAQKLDVAGTIQTTGFKLTTSPMAGYVLTSDANGVGSWQAAAGGSLWQQNGGDIYYAAGSVGVGVMSPDATLDVLGGNWDLVSTAGDLRVGNDLYGLKVGVATSGGGAGDCRIRAFGSTSKLMLGDGSNDTLTIDGSNVGIGTTVPTTKLDVIGTVKMNGFRLAASPTDGYVLTCDASGSGTWHAPTGGGESQWQAGTGGIYYNAGTVGIGTNAPDADLHVATSGAVHGVHVTGAVNGVIGEGSNYGVRGEGGNYGVYGTGTSDGVRGYCASNGKGVEGESVSGVGVRALGGGAGTGFPALMAVSTNASGIALFSTSTSSDANLVAVNKGTGDIIKGFSGATGGDMVFRVENNGKTSVSVLQITGGADLSEQFDVQQAGAEIRPGLVVCIDPDNPGKLVVSAKAYDRTVAGIISGAGGVQPGMMMGQRDSAADGAHPVALTGRVYVWADASHGPIQPGDLLTTSDVPGHAMKVTDYERSRGATLGKAMTRLAEGSGLVLMLVQPQ
jgi:hypothetical protein